MTMSYEESLLRATRLAFAPFAFQTARILRDSGALTAMKRARPFGVTTEELQKATGLSAYAVESLCEAGLSFELCRLTEEGRWALTPVGNCILSDAMTRVNMDFTQDVCYKGAFHLEEALVHGRPAGLRELGDWPTIYEGLSILPEPARTSWFAFDHFYSDRAMPPAIEIVKQGRARRLLDVGGNTGKFARRYTTADPDVHVTIADLAGQLGIAAEENAQYTHRDRIHLAPVDLLDPDCALPQGFDAVWMSQFLVCFSKPEIVSILDRARDALEPDGTLWILDTYWDNTPNEVAKYCLHGTSLYFTTMANGNSRMYSLADTLRLLARAGLEVVTRHDGIGDAHTLLECRRIR
ncbi:MAG: class I SAM-dependent methyltransferase [Myxococcota bacterium]